MTAPRDSSRRLKAIMFTDIKGYTSMMGTDEARTVTLVLEHRALVRECLAKFDGAEHETIGDAFVVLFNSVVNAVRCGAEIQNRLAARNAELPSEQQVWLRIGIHLGDIIVEDGGIYGDGVNLAARVEAKAEPGGICITEQVYLQIDGKVDFDVEPIGRPELKNIRSPPNLYRLSPNERAGSRRARRMRRLVMGLGLALFVAVIAAFVAWRVARDVTPTDGAATPLEADADRPPAVMQPAPAPNPPPASAAATAREQAAELVGAAMRAAPAERAALLQQARVLDPDNRAVHDLLEQTRARAARAAATATAAAATTTDADNPGAGRHGHAVRRSRAAAPTGDQRRQRGGTIRPAIIDE